MSCSPDHALTVRFHQFQRKRARIDHDVASEADANGLSLPENHTNGFDSSSQMHAATQHFETQPESQSQYQSQPLTSSQPARTQSRVSQPSQAIRENRPAENGIIEEVSCTNFMCHARLEVKLGPLINFIIGHNGSGKSAVLTALTLCLGGKTTATNRGASLKAFIKEGEE